MQLHVAPCLCLLLLALLACTLAVEQCEDYGNFTEIVERVFRSPAGIEPTCAGFVAAFTCNWTTGEYLAAHVASYCTASCGLCDHVGDMDSQPTQAKAVAALAGNIADTGRSYIGPVWSAADLKQTGNQSNYCW